MLSLSLGRVGAPGDSAGNGDLILQRIGIANLHCVQEVPRYAGDKDTQVSTQQRIVAGAYAQILPIIRGSEADRVGDLVTRLGELRTGLGGCDCRSDRRHLPVVIIGYRVGRIL